MVYVSGGTFMMGRDNGDDAERPPHQAPVKPFYIDIYEVTNADYEKFVKATNHRPPAAWKNGSFPDGAGSKPVTGVTWDDANDFARWAGKRLPTEEEWEFSARGTDGRLYPWSSDWQQGSANANGAEQAVADVGAYKGRAPFGTYDMVGNAWEWTASNFRAYPGRGLPSSQPTGELKVIRGGCYESTKDYATTTYRAGWPARGAPTYEQTGFRCAKDIGP
jgi:formylglycine-generating enzyme required for sulfatase activity